MMYSIHHLGGVHKTAGETPALRWACLREEHVEARAARGVLLQANRAAMIVHDFRDDGKAEAYSLFLRCEERIENLLAQFRRHAGARIFDEHGYAGLAIRDLPRNHDMQCFLR